MWQARQNADRHLGVTYVVVPLPGSSQIQGYFTLVTRTVESQQLPTTKKRLPSGSIGVVLLGRLAVDQKFALLEILLRHQGGVVSHHNLLKEVWGQGWEDDLHLLRVNIS